MRTADFIRLAHASVSYDQDRKAAFHRAAAVVLRQLAKALGYKRGEFDLRHCQGGIAVSGEITLHSDTLYVQLAQSCLGPNMGFMWRTCKGRKDYTGGPNQWATWEALLDLPRLAETMLRAATPNLPRSGAA